MPLQVLWMPNVSWNWGGASGRQDPWHSLLDCGSSQATTWHDSDCLRVLHPTHLYYWPQGRTSVGRNSYKDSWEFRSVWLSVEMALGWPQTLGPNLVLGSALEWTQTLSAWITWMGPLASKTTRALSRQEQTPGLAQAKCISLESI